MMVGFLGTEGDKYRELVNASMPQHLDITGDAHLAVGEAIKKYGVALSDATTQMGALTLKASGDHAAVQAAVVRYNTAEAVLAAATVKATAAKTAAVATAVTPAGPAFAATAAVAETELAAAKAEETAAMAHYQAMLGIWNDDLRQAASIKTQLGVDVDAQVATIDAQARKRFEENPTGLAAVWQEIDSFFDRNADLLSNISDILQIVGSIMMFIPGLQVLGAVLLAIGVGLKGLLALTGNASWGEFAFDLLTSLPGGAIFKALKAGKLGPQVAKLANGAGKFGNQSLSAVKNAAKGTKGKIGELARGARCKAGLEPVDMATGALIDFQTDVMIDGVLPLVVDRNSNSSHRLGRALGAQWVSRMDCRIEICADEVLMLSPDGALLTFPPAPIDGSEVQADGRPWLLSYGDGAYRVRDIASGLVYVFSICAEHSLLQPTAPLTDAPYEAEYPLDADSADISPHGFKESSVAGNTGGGVEIGLTSVVHRTGHYVEYFYENTTGHMTSMRRSDGTVLQLVWDQHVDRVASIWLSHEHQPEQEPERLISYEYDAQARLRRVINSAAGELAYHYDEKGRVCGWTDRNGVTYTYVFDDEDRVITQVGTGGMFPNAAVWLDDHAPDAPDGGRVCVAVETATPYTTDPLQVGDSIIPDYLERIENLPLVKALRSGGLQAAGLTGQGRDGERSTTPWEVPAEWLHDEVLGDVRPTVYRAGLTGDVWRTITPGGACLDQEYNQYHDVIRTIAADGSVTTIEYDEYGCVTAVTHADGSTTTVEPASWGVPAKITTPDGLATEYDVDLAGNITSVTDPAGLTTRFEYDWRATGLVPASSTDPAGITTTLECDNAGRVIATEDGVGRRWSLVRNPAGRVIESMNPLGDTTTIEYSPEGWPWRVTNPDGTTVRATYDGEGNVIETVNEIGAITSTQFTVFDKPTLITDAMGGHTQLLYNSQMEVVAVINPDKHRWDFTYNLDGQVTEEADYNNLITRFENNPVERWVRKIDPAGGVTTSWFDPVGKIIQSTDSDNNDTIYSYNPQGYLEEIANQHTALTYAYDQYGRVVAETTTLASGETSRVEVHRDPVGRTKQITTNTHGLVHHHTYSFDQHTGEIVTIGAYGHDLQELAAIGLGSDQAGRRNRISTGVLARTLTFDACSRPTHDVTYNLDAIPTGESDAGLPAGLVAGRQWAWRADNTITTINDALAGQATFDVDLLGRVTTVTRTPTNTASSTSTGGLNTNASSSVTGASTAGSSTTGSNAVGTAGAGVVENYGVSVAGVITTMDAPDYEAQRQEAALGLARSPRQHTKKPSAVMLQVEHKGTLVTRVGKTSYTYDKQGRIIESVTRRLSRKALVKRFTYHGSTGQLATFSSSDAPTLMWEYTYDGIGRRVAKTCRNTTTGDILTKTIFTHLGDQLVAEHHLTSSDTDNNLVGRVWITDPVTGDIIGQINHTTNHAAGAGDPATWSQTQVDATFYAMVADLAGAPQELINPHTGAIAGKATHTLFGRRKWDGETTPLLFAGQYEDTETGLVYNRYRYYNPHSGTYTAQDPLGVGPNPATTQGYVHNPTTWVDKQGLQSYPNGHPLGGKGDVIIQRWGPHNGPGPLGARDAATFRSASYTEKITTEPTTLYRAYTKGDGEMGRFWTRTEPTGPYQAVLDSALNPAWGNQATAVSRIEVPAGTRIFEGAVAPQTINGGAGTLYGGGNQIMFEPGFRVPNGWLR